MLMVVLQHIADDENPYRIVGTLLDALPPGSYLAISHPASDIEAAAMGAMAQGLNQLMAEKVTLRSQAGVARFFAGLDMVEPGVVRVQHRQPASEEEATSPAALWSGIGRRSWHVATAQGRGDPRSARR